MISCCPGWQRSCLGKAKGRSRTFAVCVEALVVDGRLRCPAAHLAARQLKGPEQEFLVWPSVMAFEEETADSPRWTW
ncbi:TetR/AcrR family transcriptional regulator C-terminal domain-containing protein [Streptomyces sp. CCM_MD2014]|uniref:TetR/AcrR family transcriptional regulator C-terminal domain-containing protein n=1 Tax=Streptomyces sp. CCM_MD2014 TaxID=1561022 RepID=UPI00052AAD2F|nr:TetR/AcrR family transcriptional regulator C-terminal domain-containing protein [Streptomyces sp. CCM_MD2014]AIV32162.1 hypothetical protein NI25_00355 [Streptomyces sp. CCM_MD2014]